MNFMEKLNRRSCVIVIPIHSATPSKNELVSFAQCFKVLYKHPIKVIAPQNLDLSVYKDVVSDFDVVLIDPKWQSSIKQYNRLKVSSFFYKLFNKYHFLLTYELDAFVFKDDLDYWCNKGYDYIGAPWFEGYIVKLSNNIVGVGNSGFSLRNVQKSRLILDRIRLLRKFRSFWFKSRLQAIWRFPNMIFFLRTFSIFNQSMR